ncbi:MAG: hypothetical protein ACI9Y7_002327 [Dokdonia sp.]|jgi:hypothetical protein
MNNLDTLNDLLGKKIKRQTILLQKSKELEKVHLTISGSKKGRWFGSSYLLIKRILSIFIGIGLITIALLFILFPEIILKNQELHDGLMSDAKKHYLEVTGETIAQTLIKITSNNDDGNYTTTDMLKNIEEGMEQSLEKEIVRSIHFLAGLMIMLAFVFLYISRTARKMKVRNHKISQAETVTQEIIQNFRKNINEEEQELVILQEMIRTSMRNKTSNNPPPRAS